MYATISTSVTSRLFHLLGLISDTAPPPARSVLCPQTSFLLYQACSYFRAASLAVPSAWNALSALPCSNATYPEKPSQTS